MTLTLKAIPGPVRPVTRVSIEPITITLNAMPRKYAKQLARKHSMTQSEYDRAHFLGEFSWDAIERGDRGGFLVEIDGQHYILSSDALNSTFRPVVPRIIVC